MGKLGYSGGWGGGNYNIDGRPFSFNRDEEYIVLIGECEVVCNIKTTHGRDSDQGHYYDWDRNDPYFTAVVFGINMELPLMNHIKEGVVFVK